MHRKMTKFLSLFLSAAMMAGGLSMPVLAEEPVSVYTETLEEGTVTDAETFPEEEEAERPDQEAGPEAPESSEPDAPEDAGDTEAAAEAQEETGAEEIPADQTGVTETEAAEADADDEADRVPAEDYVSGPETSVEADEAVEDAAPVQETEKETETETADVPVEEVVTDPVGDALTGEGYVLMNIPYDAFFEAEGISGVDAVSTATIKTYNQTMAAGSYHAGYDAADPISGAQILGVTYPVYVADMSVLEGLTQVTDADTATITVASGKSATTTKEVSGQDLLFASGDYAYYVLGQAPANYKTLSGEAGNFSFSAVQNGAVSAQIGSAELTYGGHYTALTLTVEADEVEDAAVTGVVLTADGQDYVLRHVENVWRKVSLGWNWTDLDGAGLSGKTITAITYYMQDGGIYRYAVEIPVKKNAGPVTAVFEDLNRIVVSDLPEDIENPMAKVSTVVGRGETAVVIAQDVPVENGTVVTTEPAVAGTEYAVLITSDNYADLSARAKAVVRKEMDKTTLGGVDYYYVDTTEDDADNTVYCFSVTTGRGASAVTTPYSFSRADLTQVGDTAYCYIAAPGAEPLSGTLYGYGEGTLTNYREVYGALGVSTDTDPAFDAVTSATAFTGHHAKDIPSFVVYGTDGDGNKAITGLDLGRASKTVDAVSYVEAGILKAAGSTLTEDQEAVLGVTLKVNPMTAPSSTEVPVSLSSAALTSSRFGAAEFSIVPDDTVPGYVWSEYWNSVYAATISDGTHTAGTVHWIDLYGEAAVSGRHYNNLEIALNNGKSTGSNEAAVSRFADFFDGDYIKSGTYTITVYAEGYTPLTAQVSVGVKLADKTVTYNGKAVSIDAAALTGIEGDIVYTYYKDAACTSALTGAPKNAGTYYVKAVAAGLVSSNTAKLTIKKAASTVTLKARTATYTGKAINIGKAAVKGSTGKVTYTYYSDAKCTKKVTAHVKAGTYYVRASVAADANYNAATSAAVKLVVNKAASTVTLKAKTATYTGKAINIGKAAVKGSTGKVTYTYYKDAKCTKKVTAHVNAGTYYVKASVAANTNYKAATSKAVKLVIKKKAQTISVATTSKTYAVKTVKSKAQTFAIGAKASGRGRLTYAKASGSKYLTINKTTGKITVQKKTPKGTYTIKVTVKAAATTNYTAKTVTKTIKVVVK